MDKMIEAYKTFSTATLSDAMDKLGIAGTCFGIAPLKWDSRLIGRAFTVKYEPVGVEGGTVGDYIDDVPPDHVVVLDNGGRLDCTVWGDILTRVAHQRGISGTVINGVCRDVSLSFELGYPIFSKGKFMRTGKDRVRAEGINVPVSLGDVRVRPGDLVIGDPDGVVVVPKEHEEKILEIAKSIETAETHIRNEVLKGNRLDEARRKYNYHKLQSK